MSWKSSSVRGSPPKTGESGGGVSPPKTVSGAWQGEGVSPPRPTQAHARDREGRGANPARTDEADAKIVGIR